MYRRQNKIALSARRNPKAAHFKQFHICACALVAMFSLQAGTPAQTTAPAAQPDNKVASVRTLSLHQCFELANDRNKAVVASRYNVAMAHAAVQIASAIPNPRFSLQYGWGPAFTIILAGNPQQFGWMEQFRTAGKRTKAINAARAGLGVSELQVASTLFDVHNRVRRAYAEQAASEAYAELIESQREVALYLLRTAQKRYDAGKAAYSEALQAKLGVSQFDTQRNQAQARLQQATARLALLIGETPELVEVIDVDDNGIFRLSAEKTDLVPPPEKSLPPLEQLLSTGYERRPDLQIARQQTYADRKLLTVAKSARIPDLFVDSGYQFSTFKSQQPFDLTTAPVVHNQPGVYLNFTLTAPIFYQQQGEVAQAKAIWMQDFDESDQIRWRTAEDIVTAYESVSVARANIAKFQKQLLPLAAEGARLARRSYEVGKSDIASAILAKQQYQQILSAYFDSVVAYQNAWADLEQAVGVPLTL
jgi:cobalt-zinc-cadmium efflux system outer membrane protein